MEKDICIVVSGTCKHSYSRIQLYLKSEYMDGGSLDIKLHDFFLKGVWTQD